MNIKYIGLMVSAAVMSFGAYAANGESLADKVCSYSGGISHLLVPTYQTVHLPQGEVRFYPIRRDGFTSERISGFPLAYLGHRRDGTFRIAPYSGDMKNPNTDYWFDNETSKPYKYNVYLQENGVELSFSPAKKCGIFELKFDGEENGVFITSQRGKLTASKKDGTIGGYDFFYRDNPKNNIRAVKVFVYAELGKDVKSAAVIKNGNGQSVNVKFNKGVKKAEVKYAISLISEEQAKKNFEKEMRGKNFAEQVALAKQTWEDCLGQIQIEGGTTEEQNMFYTSLYRCHERMANYSEDGQYYSAYDNKIHIDTTSDFYCDDWSWDTYRNLHPLFTILNPAMQREKVLSYIKMAEQSGRMPTFPQIYGDMHGMNGNHYASIVWDAYCKGIRGIDLKKAYDLCKKTIFETTMIPWIYAPAMELDAFYNKHGYFPGLAEGEKEIYPIVNGFEQRQAVTVTLAQSYDDWCMAQMANELGLKEDRDMFLKRAVNYRNLWNKKTGFFAPKNEKGEWIEPFNPKLSGGVGARAYFAENNAWTYIWDVTHNTNDLVYGLFGSAKAFEDKLDRMFIETLGCSRRVWPDKMPDSTGMVGQFVMGNEPSLHIPYLYNYIGKPWKTQRLIRRLTDMWFRTDYFGMPGDEDGGSMSSFYVFSALGFYPVTPGMPMYVIGTPFFKKAEINLKSGKKFTVVANNYAPEHKYIQSAKLNGKPLNRSWITHDEIMNGGVLEFEMGLRPNKTWATTIDAVPPSFEFKK